MLRKVLIFFLLIGFAFSAKAQLSDLHYLPPMKQGWNNDAIQQQAVYLSTPEPTSFVVNAFRGTSTTPIATFNISNVNPAVYNMSNGDNNIILVNNANTGTVLNNSGLRFEAPSGNRFYVNYRGNSGAQAASLTSKGRVAMGTNFKWGGVPNLGNHRSKSNTLGIMATEDNTTINLFGYDPGCEFRIGNNRAGITSNTHQITLDANESFVYETYIGLTPTQAHEDGWIGASIVSDKDIVISNGSMNFGRQVGATNRDAGIDQPVPENRLGKEYVFVRGNGNANGWTEFPLIIATADNTEIRVNGSPTPIATINNGDYFQVPSNLYSTNTVGANMHIETSQDAYAYQCLAGSSAAYTTGLNFVAPVNCLLPDVMDNIPDITNMAGTQMTGGMTIIAAVNTPDANISVIDGNGPVTLPANRPVAGSSNWKTFYIPNLSGNVSVQSTGPMAVGFFGFNGAKGVAGYFSGFDTVPEVTLEIRGGTGCFVGSEIFEATNSNFDAFQWYKDGEIVPGANSPIYSPDGAGQYFLRGTKGPCTYDSNPILGLYCDPDIHIEKTVDKSEIMEGETATFTIRVQNWGVGPLTNLQITDNIPSGLTFVNAFTLTGNWSGNTWNIGTLEGGEVAELELEVVADEIDTLPLLSLTNTATHSQDQTDTNTTLDNPSARIVVHNDFDNDGVRDITDVDDDNDGVYDEDECETLSFNISSGSEHNSSLISVENYLILDIFSLDNSFNLEINGTDVAGEIQFQNAPGNFARFFDGSGYGESGNPQVYQITGSDGTPLIRVVIDQFGQFQLFGSRSSNGPLEPMALTTPASTFTWDPSGNNTVIIDQEVVGPTNMSGVLLTAGCDTDGDGLPDQLDLDSDGDGCSDANEFYKDDNADGGDGGEYGTGAPAVDPSDGSVIAASYIKVYGPEILLGNTAEDLSGIDINGDELSLGQTFNYVLRFQNTGDDNATNYTIRDVLPNNVTVDNIDISNVLPGTVVNHDVSNGIITFSIPDNLVEVGDPEYSISITVTISPNCSSFVDACSSILSNSAFSTYQGIINTDTFTDENGSNSITACPRTPEVTTNSILNDLTNCSESRTVLLCGTGVLLTAGQGFTSYHWVLDTNNNGQVDASDTEMNDDPDGDPSTMMVTAVGVYIVEKSSTGGCPDLVERITVERFGSTQTNPIVEYFNQVNADVNPDNNIQGEIRTDCIDGSTQFADIFLCGAADSALLQMNIPDGELFWEKLDETSCSVEPDGCLTRNLSCTWNQVGTGSDFTVDAPGIYRLSITYQGGCPSRFYFNAFQNNLDFGVTSSDILCTTPGNIRITGVGAGYGFQLVNANDNSPVVDFSANNGPNFDIATIGTYKVQITALNPSDGTPIAGSCIYETEDIGIAEQIFDVTLSSTSADCNDLGTISIAALNARPNYSYELVRVVDGSDAGTQLAVNDNTHTFTNVLPGDYTVITSTQDGCSISRNINVAEIAKLTLGAVTSENITCTPGIVNLTPGGGLPSPDYEMAIWSIDGITAYTDGASVPDSEFQTNASFLFGDTGNPNRDGEYIFILRDGNGCFAESPAVTVLDLGTVTISATNTQIICSDSSTASLTVSASGGNAPYQFSLDGGTNYQNTDTFVNLSAGFYTITVMDSSGDIGLGCVENFDYEIIQPFRLTASATILEDASCSPTGALVKIINANGGQAPYLYSINGGTFSGVNTANLLPGNHDFTVQDALGCTFEMELTVPSSPSDPSFSNAVDYNCDGEGNISITPSNTTDFTYSYALNTTPNTPLDNNVFTNVADGTHTITIGYSGSISPGQSTLFFEDFGAGPTTQIAEIGPDYCFEPQDFSTVSCNRGPAGILVNGEYTVTSLVTNPITSLTSPQDHTGLTDGRFLAIDISTFSDTGNERLNTVLWTKQNIEVLPNREINLTFWAYNLMNTTGAGNNPEVLVEILDNSGTLIYSAVAPEIPKNNNNLDWHERTITFDPGTNTDIDIVLKSNVNSNDGNDLILDDIQANQTPEVCAKTADITVIVEDNKEFSTNILGTQDPSCNGGTDGSIRFEVLNFDLANGFQYSTDNVNWTTSMVSEVTTSTPMGVGSNTVWITSLPTTPASCTTDFSVTLDEPTVIVPTLIQTAPFTCFNTGATLEASAIGGTPGYEYQLEGTITRPYQTDATFLNVPAGNYVVRVQDAKLCNVVSTTTITISAPETIDFDLSTVCYDGLNNGSVTVSVNTGNGYYLFRRVGLTWQAPTPTTATTYTFTGLTDGSYDIEVSDAFGCVSSIETIVIAQALTASIDIVDVSTCADGSITVNAIGGDLNYVYAYVPTSDVVADTDFSSSNTFAVTSLTAGDYNVYVRDNGGVLPRCEFQRMVTIQNAPVLAFDATPTNAICYGETGSIAVNITSGRAPYTYQLIDTDNSTSDQTQTGLVGTTKTYFNLLPGNYDVIITDAFGCSISDLAITIAQPDELTATITGFTPGACSTDINEFGFRFTGYPTTVGTIEFSADGGGIWIGDNSIPGTSDELRGYLSGTTVYPSMRTDDGSGNICQTDFPPLVIPYPLDDLDITILPIIVDCDELQVTVRGEEGTAPYYYTYSDNPANFDPVTPVNGWFGPFAAGVTHTFPNLIPGKSYAFYVRDSSTPACVRQSNVNVNDIVNNPMEITAAYEPSCNGANNGEITYTIVDDDGTTEPQMNWTLYDINDNAIQTSGIVPYASSIVITSLPANEYYIVVTQVDSGGVSQCISGSENLLLEELDTITATLNPIQNISCESPGIIRVENIQGGGGTFSYTVTGPVPFTTITGTTDNPIEIAANSPAGDYHIQITDQFGCSSIVYTETLTLSPNPVITSLNVDNCGNSTTVTIHPGSPSLFYSIDGGTTYFSNEGIFSGVAEGNYTAVLKDGNGCTVSQAFVVEPSIQATASLAEDLGCGPGQEGEIVIEVTTGSGVYEYEILNSAGADVVTRGVLLTNPTTELITSNDTYTVNIYDMTSNPVCERPFTIVVPVALVPDFTADPTDVTCFGFDNGSISVTPINNGNTPHTYSISPNAASFNVITNSFENLPPDSYTITALGPNGCSTTSPVIVIDAPDEILFSTLPTVTPFGCSSGNSPDNATISINTLNIAGGTDTFNRFEFEEVTSGDIQNGTDTNYIFTDKVGGDVIVRAFDDNGCVGEVTITVPPYDELYSATIIVDGEISCDYIGEDMHIVINAVNPANYVYRELPSGTFDPSSTFTDLQPGTHSFTIRNNVTGCEITIDHIVEEPNTVEFSVQKLTDAICFGGDGRIQLNISDPTYTGDYTWTIYNPQGTPIDRSDDTVTLSMPLGADPTTPINIIAGNYIVEVIQDAFPGCPQFRSFTIETPSAEISLDALNVVHSGCSDDQGSTTITPLGGLAPYNITLTNNRTGTIHPIVNQVNSDLFQGLAHGIFTVDIVDALGCTRSFPDAFEILLPDPISGSLTADILSCAGDSDANIEFILDLVPPRNVTPNYTYVLHKYSDASKTSLFSSTASQTSPIFENQGAGFYTIFVEDDMGCQHEATTPIEIIDPTEVSGELVTTQTISCTADAELELTVTGGTGTYEWSTDGINFNPMTGGNTHLFQNVTAGSYQYFIQDSNNCDALFPTNEIIINAIVDLTALPVDASIIPTINCNGEATAVIDWIADGGLGNYDYSLYSDATLATEVRPFQATGTFADLPAGSYFLQVRSEDCRFTSAEILIEEPDELIVTPIPTNITCFGANDGIIEFDITGGTSGFQYAISPNLDKFIEDGLFENLTPGDYTVIVQDANGCFALNELTITEPERLAMTLSATPEICAGEENGTITVTIADGTGTPPYSTAIDSENNADFVEGRLIFENLAGGVHTVFVRDANGCPIDDLITIESGANLNATLEVIYECTGDTPNNRLDIVFEDSSVPTDVLYAIDSTDPNDLVLEPNFENLSAGDHYLYIVHENGCPRTIDFEVEGFEPLQLSLEQLDINEITATTIGGKEGYTYYIDGQDNGNENTFYIKRTDVYTIRVVDENGCESISAIEMEFIDIEIPNFFTPDGDGQNDFWIPRNISQFPEIFIKIYDRYGREVYRIQDTAEGWGGLYQETELPTGDYWYVIKLNGAEDDREFVGNFTLYR